MEIKTKIDIAAPPAKVWAILTDFEKYPTWNPFIKSIIGDPQPGQAIKVELDGTKFSPTVLAYEKNREFRWVGRLLFKGIFDGEHCLKLIEQPNGNTTFEQSEKFTGLLVPFFKKMLSTKTKPGFEGMNNALKERAEK